MRDLIAASILSSKRQFSLWLLMAFYLAAGINHFVMPAFYLPLIPDYFPDKELLNLLSGIAEISVAIGLMFRGTRKWAAWGIISLLLAFLPAHIWFIQKGGCIDPGGLCVPLWVAWFRLFPVHAVLLYWAWVHTR